MRERLKNILRDLVKGNSEENIEILRGEMDVKEEIMSDYLKYEDIKVSDEDMDRVYGDIQKKIKAISHGGKNITVWAYRIAAVIVLLVGSFFVFKSINNPFSFVYSVNNEIVLLEKGQMKSMDLPDGSKVWLNADSKLRYFDNNLVNKREVYLEGEAYFEVARDENRPFQIHVNNSLVKVLGTKFNVKAYPGMNKIVTSVVSGLVEFSVNKEKVLLPANSRGVYNKKANSLKMAVCSTKDVNSWIEGRLIFRASKLSDIVTELKRKYNVEIRLQESLGNKIITASFKEGNIDKVLDLLSLTNEFKYKKGKDGYSIYE